MKIRNLILVLSALALPLQAADVGTSYLNLPVAVLQGKTKLVSIFLARPAIVKGELFSPVTAGQSTFTAYGDNVFSSYSVASEVGAAAEKAPASDNLYIVEFTSGPSTGLVKQVLSFSGSTVTVKGTLPALTAETQFVLRKDNTLNSVFGSEVTQGTSTANADVVSILSSQGLTRYIYVTGFGWRSELARRGSDVDCGNARISLGTGVAFKSRSNKSINLSGEYRGSRSLMTVPESGAIVGNPYPVAVSLQNSGLAGYLTKAVSGGDADVLRFLETGSYVEYHHNGTDFVKSLGNAVSNSKQLGVGDAFLFLPQNETTIAFAPQVITK